MPDNLGNLETILGGGFIPPNLLKTVHAYLFRECAEAIVLPGLTDTNLLITFLIHQYIDPLYTVQA